MRSRYTIALGLLAAAILVQILRTAYHSVLSMGGKSICPRCGALYIHLSSHRGIGDSVYRIFGCLPYRCKVCELRFHRPRV
jgi:hypothetical protein